MLLRTAVHFSEFAELNPMWSASETKFAVTGLVPALASHQVSTQREHLPYFEIGRFAAPSNVNFADKIRA